jgi:hypothetical protein
MPFPYHGLASSSWVTDTRRHIVVTCFFTCLHVPYSTVTLITSFLLSRTRGSCWTEMQLINGQAYSLYMMYTDFLLVMSRSGRSSSSSCYQLSHSINAIDLGGVANFSEKPHSVGITGCNMSLAMAGSNHHGSWHAWTACALSLTPK